MQIPSDAIRVMPDPLRAMTAEREGIPLGADHWKLVHEIAHSLSVDTPWRSNDA